MQDMATMQQHSITSPAAASTIQNEDSVTDAHFGAEIQHEASRTDTENYEDTRHATKTANEEVDDGNERNTTNETTCNNKNSRSQSIEGNENDASDFKDVTKSDESSGNSEVNSDSRARTGSDDDPDTEDCSAESGDSEMKFLCPICDTVLCSQHDFTLHIRSHNNDGENLPVDCLKTFTCKICHKVLSSSSSLDRHVLVHSGERPFKCLICGVAFTTNGNMHRHMRTHNNLASKSESSNNYESDGSTDSSGSFNSKKSPLSSPPPGNNITKKRRVGYHTPSPTETKPSASSSPNGNENGNKRKLPELFPSDAADSGETASRRRIKAAPNSHHDIQESSPEQSLHCPVCNREDFVSLNVLETHLEENHPEYQIRCHVCDQTFRNNRALNLHRHMAQHDKVSKGTKSNSQQQHSSTVLGFNDLTFVDFSSKKFPHIAVAVCEKSLHKPSSAIRFQCDKCGHAFPCATALNIHQRDSHGRCSENETDPSSNSDIPTDLSSNRRKKSVTMRSSESEEEIEERKREDFFAGLDLQNKSVPSSPSGLFEQNRPKKEAVCETSVYYSPLNGERNEAGDRTGESGRDLADIQSIISVTSARGLIQDLSKSPPQTSMMSPDSGVRTDSAAGEEEQQDCFAAEFRRMKLKGEFPCRLCSAVFPNLRALKGHNRSHLSASVGIFRCNMCPYSNPDKATLVRHMRTHNGDRPYECALCNYAFTTKANCERHLRNRHSKLSREDVKKSIIYHPSEDPTNDPDLQAKVQAREDVKRSLVFTNQHSSSLEDLSATEHSSNYQHSLDECKGSNSPDEKLKTLLQNEEFKHESRRIQSPHQNIIEQQAPSWEKTQEVATMTTNVRDEEELEDREISYDGGLNKERESNDTISSIEALVNLTKNNNNTFPKLPVTENQRFPNKESMEMTSLRHSVSSFPSPIRDVDSPLDLSMDALDLSKKRHPYKKNFTATPTKEIDNAEPQDLTKKHRSSEFNNRSPSTVFSPKSEQSLNSHQHGSSAQQMLTSSRGTAMSPHENSQSPTTLPKLDINTAAATGFYGNPQLNHLYLNNNSFPFHHAQHPFALHPYFMPHTPALLQNSNMEEFRSRLHKELINNLQLSGGTIFDSMMVSTAERLQAIHNQAFSDYSRGKSDVKMGYGDVKVEETRQPQVISAEDFDKSASGSGISKTPPVVKVSVAPKSAKERDNSSVKMVIKNGVLMPKQKQRRYRTERPFACEHCSARFTLRSNMERHIKQQHPQYWTQRQRSNVGSSGPGRRSHTIPTSLTMNLNIPGHQDMARKSIHSDADNVNTQSKSNTLTRHVPTVISVPEPPNNYQISHLVQDDFHPGRGDRDAQHQIMVPKITDEITTDSALVEIVQKTKDNSSIVINNNKNLNNNNNNNNNNYSKAFISEEVKFAIAQQLKSKLNHPVPTVSGAEVTEKSQEEARKDVDEDIDDENELVIDEEKDVEEEVTEKKQPKEETKEKFSDDNSRVGVTGGAKDVDLASVSRLLDNATTHTQAFQRYFRGTQDGDDALEGSEEDEEGLVAGSNSEGNNSGSDENKSECELGNTNTRNTGVEKKKSAYSLAPNRVSCPYCPRTFPWSSSLRRHVLTHTGQKPYKCPHCSLLFTTKSNCDRHLLRKHGGQSASSASQGGGSSSSSETSPGSSSGNYTMRNVPERPYKCNYCPSSTFSTQSNLKKHVQTKHNPLSPAPVAQPLTPRTIMSADEGCNVSTAGSSRPESRYGGDESHGSGSEDTGDDRVTSQLEHNLRQQENNEHTAYNLSSAPADCQRGPFPSSNLAEGLLMGTKAYTSAQASSAPESHTCSTSGAISSADLPFKCHLCEGSYAERQEALEHIRESHPSEFELLMSKGALDSSSSTGTEDNNNVSNTPTPHPDEGTAGGEESLEQLRGKFPDYANRKVMCAFCMRRFWSAEDLRRHMRTHTGERPFSCDICRRRFTLKHSMLRHRKKHNNSTAIYNSSTASAEDVSVVSGDEEHPSSGTSLRNMLHHRNKKHCSGEDATGVSGDEEVGSSLSGSVDGKPLKMTNHNNNNITTVSAAKGMNHWDDDSENFTASAAAKILSSKFSLCTTGTPDRRDEADDDNTDLIGNLLGIQGSIIDKVLQSTSAADEAARLLGVQNGENQE